MSNSNVISAVHLEKLDHNIDEIKLRALDNIISKLDDGFKFNSPKTEREFIHKLFNWFISKSLPCSPDKILNLIHQLINTNQLNAHNYGNIEFRRKLSELKTKLDSTWHGKLNDIESAVSKQLLSSNQLELTHTSADSQQFNNEVSKNNGNNIIENINEAFIDEQGTESYCEANDVVDKAFFEQISHLQIGENKTTSSLASDNLSTTPVVSKQVEEALRWLVFPWQPLVSSDYGVLSAVEETLNSSINTNTNAIIRTCQFISNVMLQDFPAEVFLQRPSIVMILQALLQQCCLTPQNTQCDDVPCITSMVLRTLHKLTRSLRFRIYYYRDSSIVNRKQGYFGKKNDSLSLSHSMDHGRENSTDEFGKDYEELVSKMNYNAASYQQPSNAVVTVTDSTLLDESSLQMKQMLIPNYCIETLGHILKLLMNIPIDDYYYRPMKDTKNMMDLNWELLQLLIASVTPSIWMCSDEISRKIHEDLKVIMELLGNVLQYLTNYHNIDYCRISYLHLICMTLQLLCSLIPLEVANLIIPNNLKTAICTALVDPSIYIMYPELNAILHEYVQHFRGTSEMGYVKLFDEIRFITKSMKAAIIILKSSLTINDINVDTLKLMYVSQSSLNYHKNLSIIEKYIYLIKNIHQLKLNTQEKVISVKLLLHLLANGDQQVRIAAYKECHSLVSSVLFGIDTTKEIHEKKYTCINVNCISFLCNSNVLTEIICHGMNDEDKVVKKLSEDIIIFLLKGKIQMQNKIWLEFIEALLPVLSLLQCYAEMKSPLGQCISKMFDPDISVDIQLPHTEVIKGNMRFLFSLDNTIREEGSCRLIYLLENEKNSTEKLPRLASLHGLPLASLIFNHVEENRPVLLSFDGKYEKSSILSVLEMFKVTPSVEPKIRKSALVQLSVILTDKSLHELFLRENGLSYILEIFEKALIEKNYENYPDSVVPIITILKLLVLSQPTVRNELSNRSDILMNILRSVFLFPNNLCIKADASILLFLLLFNDQLILLKNKSKDGQPHDHQSFEISLPYIILKNMQLPFISNSHWKFSINRKPDTSIIHFGHPIVSTFLRQYWAWRWSSLDELNNSILSMEKEDLDNLEIAENLRIRESERICLKLTSVSHCCQQQLLNIQASTTHQQVMCALDYLWMYIKYISRLEHFMKIQKLTSMPWEKTFQRFLLCSPTNKEDGHLYVNILNFLNILINITHDSNLISWLSKSIKNITKFLSDIVENFDLESQDIHQSILRLVRSLCHNNFEEKSLQIQHQPQQGDNTWNVLIQLLISNLCFNDPHQQHREQQQHFYNLVYLDWLLTCLIHLTSRCQWDCPRDLLVSLGNALIELITSFHSNGAVSFMGLSITRNSIICLNHLIHYMKINFQKPNDWTLYWYQQKERNLSWIPILWKNRDPLIRASALQLLAGLIQAPHNAQQLLNALIMAPSELCQELLKFIVNREECCIVKEHACIALSNLIKTSSDPSYEYVDSLESNAIFLYIERMNVYHEINLICSNIFMLPSLDSKKVSESPLYYNNSTENNCNENENFGTQRFLSLPKAILHLYSCHDEMLILSSSSAQDHLIDANSFPEFLSTPSLITSICKLLNNLIIVGEYECINKIHEHSLDKYFVRCLGSIPKISSKFTNNLNQYCDILGLYSSICIILTNCIIYSKNFAAAVNFSLENFVLLFSYLNKNHFNCDTNKLIHLYNKLSIAVFTFFSALSSTESQNDEALKNAIEIVGLNIVVESIYDAINQNVDTELRMSAIACLSFLLSKEIMNRENAIEEAEAKEIEMKDKQEKCNNEAIGYNSFLEVSTTLSTTFILRSSICIKNDDSDDNDASTEDKNNEAQQITLSSGICKILIHLLIAHNYANKSNFNVQRSKDKNIIIGALTNLLSISIDAKNSAIEENLSKISIMILKELYTELNLQPFNNIKRMNAVREKKGVSSLFSDLNRIMLLLINFGYNNQTAKKTISQSGLADMIHKLWVWISLNDSTLLTSLKLMATITTNCPEGAQSLTSTTTLWPVIGPRKMLTTGSLIHVIIHMITKEIDRTDSHLFNIQRLQLSFNILRNAVHSYDCRVSIAKSNLFNFFPKIHPSTTKRTKPWLFVEVYCLEFLIDFTFYEEGQTSVSKATDAVEVLIQLARCNTAATRILSLSTLRNLLFNTSNRPRFISSMDFLNLLHRTLKNGSLCEIGIAGSMLWSIVANNQKGKLVARTSGLSSCLHEVLGRLTLMPEKKQQDVAKMLQYVIKILNTDF
ncbi:rotatin [Chelonus insularis]|uniref:rotatin n=1 Tax=Chelonus insularis TaxID=460826 RepID=UPI00158D5302|nr:rotatin [Chelonus insularis]